MTVGKLVFAALLLAAPVAGQEVSPNDVKVIRGLCLPSSHVDIGDGERVVRQLPLSCDSAVFSYQPRPKTMMVQFASHTGSGRDNVGFSGQMLDRYTIRVVRIYLAGSPISVDEGNCSLDWEGKSLKSVVCQARAVNSAGSLSPRVNFITL